MRQISSVTLLSKESIYAQSALHRASGNVNAVPHREVVPDPCAAAVACPSASASSRSGLGVADHGRSVVWEDAGHRREVATVTTLVQVWGSLSKIISVHTVSSRLREGVDKCRLL